MKSLNDWADKLIANLTLQQAKQELLIRQQQLRTLDKKRGDEAQASANLTARLANGGHPLELHSLQKQRAEVMTQLDLDNAQYQVQMEEIEAIKAAIERAEKLIAQPESAVISQQPLSLPTKSWHLATNERRIRSFLKSWFNEQTIVFGGFVIDDDWGHDAPWVNVHVRLYGCHSLVTVWLVELGDALLDVRMQCQREDVLTAFCDQLAAALEHTHWMKALSAWPEFQQATTANSSLEARGGRLPDELFDRFYQHIRIDAMFNSNKPLTQLPSYNSAFEGYLQAYKQERGAVYRKDEADLKGKFRKAMERRRKKDIKEETD